MRCEDDPQPLAFTITDGPTQNAFFRRGSIAAHLAVTSGPSPRILVAFPAGNAGLGLWCEPLPAPVAISIDRAPTPILREDGLRGIAVTIASAAPELRFKGAVLGNARALRRFHRTGVRPAALAPSIDVGTSITIHRTALHGRRYVLTLTPQGGATAHADGDHLVLRAPGPLRFTLTALTDEPALTPLAARDLLLPGATTDARALAFLAYEEKLLAGSWRFLTYFGRDTLLSLALLAPSLRPAAFEAGLGAVLDRLSSNGLVAHEEAIGEEAATIHLAEGRDPTDHPVLDHGMIDDDFLLAPIAADYLLDRVAPERARAFLARRTPAGDTYAAALAKNLAFVLRRARPELPISLPDGRTTGDWRDSDEGLGHGRTPFGVNAALVPAALESAGRLLASPLLAGDTATAAHCHHLAEAFDRAADRFTVHLPRTEAQRRLAAYAASLDIDPAPLLASITGDVTFPALSLDASGAPIPILSSDEAFILLFRRPSPATLESAVTRLLRPFPAGLLTPVGLVVANPAFCDDAVTRSLFTAGHYHGTVVWSWQQALLAAGLDRQLARRDLPPATRAMVASGRRKMDEVLQATEAWRSSELWSLERRGGTWEHVAFGADRGHATESNAIQLWSVV